MDFSHCPACGQASLVCTRPTTGEHFCSTCFQLFAIVRKTADFSAEYRAQLLEDQLAFDDLLADAENIATIDKGVAL